MKIMEQADITCIQEHWLYTFEHQELDRLSTSHNAHSKSVDMQNNILPTERTRGHAGIATIWKDSIDRAVKNH